MLKVLGLCRPFSPHSGPVKRTVRTLQPPYFGTGDISHYTEDISHYGRHLSVDKGHIFGYTKQFFGMHGRTCKCCGYFQHYSFKFYGSNKYPGFKPIVEPCPGEDAKKAKIGNV
jgi:hypothetical protein